MAQASAHACYLGFLGRQALHLFESIVGMGVLPAGAVPRAREGKRHSQTEVETPTSSVMHVRVESLRAARISSLLDSPRALAPAIARLALSSHYHRDCALRPTAEVRPAGSVRLHEHLAEPCWHILLCGLYVSRKAFNPPRSGTAPQLCRHNPVRTQHHAAANPPRDRWQIYARRRRCSREGCIRDCSGHPAHTAEHHAGGPPVTRLSPGLADQCAFEYRCHATSCHG